MDLFSLFPYDQASGSRSLESPSLSIGDASVELNESFEASFSGSEPSIPVSISMASLCDELKLSHLWDYIFGMDISVDAILEQIQERRQEIEDYKKQHSSGVMQISCDTALERVKQATSGVYLMQKGSNRYIVKPADEGMYCLNHPKKWGSPFRGKEMQPKPNIPPGRTVEIDCLCFFVAQALGIAYITPQVERAVITSSDFFDISQAPSGKIVLPTPLESKEKLCSIQSYIEESEKLTAVIYDLLANGYSLEQIVECFDAGQIEDLHLLLWCCYDTDAHLGNFLVFKDCSGALHIRKIDNSLCFPDSNQGFTNHLMHLVAKDRCVSAGLREKMQTISVEKIVDKISQLGLPQQLRAAFESRIDVLKTLALKEDLTLYEVNLRMYLMSYPQVEQDLFCGLAVDELEQIAFGKKWDYLKGED